MPVKRKSASPAGPRSRPLDSNESLSSGALSRASSDGADSGPDRESRVRAKAHELWLSEGQPRDGDDLRRWRSAEDFIATLDQDKTS